MPHFNENDHQRDSGGKFTHKPHAEAGEVSLRGMGPRAFTIPGDASPDELDELADHHNYPVRLQVAGHPNTATETLRRIAQSADEGYARANAIDYLDARGEDVNAYAHDPSAEVRIAVVSSASVLPGVLGELAGDSDVGVREAVARNALTPTESLVALAGDEDAGVRRGVAGNPMIPAQVVPSLVRDPNDKVRADLAWNQHVPVGSIDALADDAGLDVRVGLAGNPRASASALRGLVAGGPHLEEVRASVAGNLAAPRDVLEMLAGDESVQVRMNVAWNLSASEKALRRARVGLGEDYQWGPPPGFKPTL